MKFGLRFTGVSLDTLLDVVGVNPTSSHVLAQTTNGYTSSLTLDEVVTNKAWVVYAVNEEPLPTEHGGPLRLLVPDRYLWKSVKWLTEINVLDRPTDGFWEQPIIPTFPGRTGLPTGMPVPAGRDGWPRVAATSDSTSWLAAEPEIGADDLPHSPPKGDAQPGCPAW
jgi:DMSO/TMAO reductase YedYZ molybdopterin-dependent catalytic subunit